MTAKIDTTLKSALSFYNQGVFHGQFKKLQRMMSIFHCKKKEIFVMKEDFERNKALRKGYAPTYNSKVDELVENMMVDVADDMILSIDEHFNSHLHSLKNDDSMMKMSIGKNEGKLTIYIRAVVDKTHQNLKKFSYRRHKVPPRMLKNHFFGCFTAAELFKMRLVCKPWKEIITKMWHGIFMREMHNHLFMSECTKEVERNLKLMAVRQPVSQKFALFSTAISQLLVWEELRDLANSETHTLRRITRLLLTNLAKLVYWEEVEINELGQYSDEIFDTIIMEKLENNAFRDRIQEAITRPETLPSLEQLGEFEENFMNYSEIWSTLLRAYDRRELIMLRLLARHTLQYALVRNSMMVSKQFLGQIKIYLKDKKNSFSENRSFLEGAYKIMIFSNASVINGKVVTLNSSLLEKNIFDGMKESIQVTNLLQNLFTNEEVLTTFLSENKDLIKDYFDTMKLYNNQRSEENEIISKIEKEAKEVQGTLESITELALESRGINRGSRNPHSSHPLGEYQMMEEELQDDSFENEIIQQESSPQDYIRELIERVDESKTDQNEPLSILLEDNSFVWVMKQENKEQAPSIKPSFIFEKGSSHIKIYMDSGATDKFLADALRYLECMMQVKRLNLCLRRQFESVQKKLRHVEHLCKEEIKNREEKLTTNQMMIADGREDGGGGRKVDAQMETMDIEARQSEGLKLGAETAEMGTSTAPGGLFDEFAEDGGELE